MKIAIGADSAGKPLLDVVAAHLAGKRDIEVSDLSQSGYYADLSKVVAQSVLDGRIKVNSLKALQATRELAEVEGIFAGVSTGASLNVAVRVCKRLPEGSKIVALSPDGGWKYLSTGAYAPGDVREIATRISGTLWA
jgi:cysteine synthase